MNLEKIKSFVLVFLIILSLLLTLGIWNYQPNYDEFTDDLIDAKLDGKEETKKSIIQPSQIILHSNDTKQGFISKSKERQLYNYIQELVYYEFDQVANSTDQIIPDIENMVEVVFPTELPMSIVQDLFTIVESDIDLPNTWFDRMFISLSPEQSNKNVYFINSSNGSILRANIQNIPDVRENIYQRFEQGDLGEYIAYTVGENKTIYLPNEIDMSERPVQANVINANTLRDILFSAPSTVRNSRSATGTTIYTDDTRTMEVYPYHMEYTNPTLSTDSQHLSGRQLINQTLNFINSHQGWTTNVDDAYQLYDLNMQSNTIEYRLSYDGYPVFENNNYSTITIRLQDQMAYHYNRPIIHLKSSFTGRKVDDIYTANEVISYLELHQPYPKDLIEDIAVGYRIKEQQRYIFDLTPGWFIKTRTGWRELNLEESTTQGGDLNAMGSN